MQVAHWDGDRTNPRLGNLRYATPLDNAADKHRHRTTARGVGNGMHKVTDDEIREIIAHYSAGEIQVRIAERYGISQSQVSNIVRGAAWSHIERKVAS